MTGGRRGTTPRAKPWVATPVSDPELNSSLDVMSMHVKGLAHGKRLPPTTKHVGRSGATGTPRSRGPLRKAGTVDKLSVGGTTRSGRTSVEGLGDARLSGFAAAVSKRIVAMHTMMSPTLHKEFDHICDLVENDKITVPQAWHRYQGLFVPDPAPTDGQHEDSYGGMGAGNCEQCAVLTQQVSALAQGLAGLGACVFNWSAGLSSKRRRSLALRIVEYCKPCAHIDDGLDFLCYELENARISENERPSKAVQTRWRGPLVQNERQQQDIMQQLAEAAVETADLSTAALGQTERGIEQMLDASQPYEVSNALLRADNAFGVQFRRSPDMTDLEPGQRLARWGSIVYGVDLGNGWLQVGSSYLPILVQGVPVLLPRDEEAVEREQEAREAEELARRQREERDAAVAEAAQAEAAKKGTSGGFWPWSRRKASKDATPPAATRKQPPPTLPIPASSRARAPPAIAADPSPQGAGESPSPEGEDDEEDWGSTPTLGNTATITAVPPPASPPRGAGAGLAMEPVIDMVGTDSDGAASAGDGTASPPQKSRGRRLMSAKRVNVSPPSHQSG